MISASIPCSWCSRSTSIWSSWYHRLHLCDGTDSNTPTTGKSPVRWSDLPSELWELIGNRLETEIDIIRFRSVCSSWRRLSLPPINAVNSPIFTLYRKTIFHIIPIRRPRTSFSSSNKQQSKLHFTKLFSSRLMYDNEARGKESKLNLLDFRINQVAESYTLKSICNIRKIIISPNFPTIIAAVYGRGKLGFTKQEGNNVWRLIDLYDNNYEDLIVHKKKIYAINRWGEIFRIIDSMMQLIKLHVPPCGYGDQKHLVECGGEIHVVNRLVDGRKEVIDFEVYRLDEEERRWVYVDNLGNYSFVLRKDCSFSVDEGVKRNCIYFNKVQDWRGTCSIDGLFDLKDRRFIKLV